MMTIGPHGLVIPLLMYAGNGAPEVRDVEFGRVGDIEDERALSAIVTFDDIAGPRPLGRVRVGCEITIYGLDRVVVIEDSGVSDGWSLFAAPWPITSEEAGPAKEVAATVVTYVDGSYELDGA